MNKNEEVTIPMQISPSTLADRLQSLAHSLDHLSKYGSVRTACASKDALVSALASVQFLSLASVRPMLSDAWEGPGFYDISVECGLSQDMSVSKTDDMAVVCQKVKDLTL